jgi:hypothetical protein
MFPLIDVPAIVRDILTMPPDGDDNGIDRGGTVVSERIVVVPATVTDIDVKGDRLLELLNCSE